ncbi:hypothetical protein [Streptomyces sp. NPDC005283]|uniref:hypothetical protein n=1 Tax=Streptomyces sp. NPDC005283 TaxID=3156871 RepID=UPI00345572E2
MSGQSVRGPADAAHLTARAWPGPRPTAAHLTAAARNIAESVTGNPDAQEPSGSGPIATPIRASMNAIRLDFAEAGQWVFYGMTGAPAVAFPCSLARPGTRVTQESPDPAAAPTGRTQAG